jgi:FemAB-related protein (PEP-CTERM system-associated)
MHLHVDASPGEEWDRFCAQTPGATLGHASAFARVLREGYGLEPEYWVARCEAGAPIEGVLPLCRFRGLTGARQLVSLPFLDSAGVLAASDAAREALLARAAQRAGELAARFCELRQTQATALIRAAESAPDRVDLALALEPDEERQWKAIGAKTRNQTRKAEKEGLTLAAGANESLLDAFYEPFVANMRDLGSPVHSRRFFAALVAAFGDQLRLIVTTRGAQPVGGLVAIHHQTRVYVPWASTLRSERARCPNNQLYWEAIRWAIRRGAREFDFGRSPIDSGTHRFKLGWGAQERPLAWARVAPSGQIAALAGLEKSALLERLSQLWTRLPLGLTRALGPRLRRHLSN